MYYTSKLFRKKDIYNHTKYESLFFKAIKENCLYLYKRCSDYKKLLDDKSFDISTDLKSIDDINKIPFIPTLYLKRHKLTTIKHKALITVTSSGTSGKNRSEIDFNFGFLLRAWNMTRKVAKYHKLWSIKPTRYLILGYKPNKKNPAAVTKTAFAATFFAPGVSRTYAIDYINGEYKVDLDKLKNKLIKFAKGRLPVRTMGFPAYTYFLLKQMKEEGIKVKQPKGSKIMLGGGWKQFYAEKVDKIDFYKRAEEVLGINDKNIVEFFGAVEHPILYTDCREHHFHIPIYSKIIIRDVSTLEPLKEGQVGLINLITPISSSSPLISIMTDDLGVLHSSCKCGEEGQYLEIIGRVGIKDIITCAQGAEEILKQ